MSEQDQQQPVQAEEPAQTEAAAEEPAVEEPAAEEPAAEEPAAEEPPAQESNAVAPAEPEPAPAPVKVEEAEEEVAAADLYKTAAHVDSPVGGPFDPTAPGCHPYRDVDGPNGCQLVKEFLKSSTLWVSYAACSDKNDFLEYHNMGDDIKSLKASMDATKNTFYLLKCKAQDVKSNVVSERARLIRLTVLGTSVPIMKRRFKLPSENAWNQVTHSSITNQIECNDACDWLGWMKQLQRAGGAHQPTSYQFGPDEVWNVPQ